MQRFIAFFTLVTASALALAPLPVRAVDTYQGVIAVVISKDQSTQALKLSPKNLSLIFWRKQRYWPKGISIKPINLDAKHPIRLAFSQSILGSKPNAQVAYWNGQYFNGIKPPYSVKSEEAILRYIAKTQGAIGYVDACRIDQRVKPVFWIVNHRIETSKPTKLNCD